MGSNDAGDWLLESWWKDGWDAVSLVLRGSELGCLLAKGWLGSCFPGGCVGGERMCVLEALGEL
jgi:hypothetical protein